LAANDMYLLQSKQLCIDMLLPSIILYSTAGPNFQDCLSCTIACSTVWMCTSLFMIILFILFYSWLQCRNFNKRIKSYPTLRLFCADQRLSERFAHLSHSYLKVNDCYSV